MCKPCGKTFNPSKIPFMKETGGGWVISPDHRVIKETSLSDFQYFIDRAKELAKF